MKRMPWEVTREMFLDEGEVRRLLRHVRREVKARKRDRARAAARLDELIVECLLFSGLRNSELCRLALSDVSTGPGKGAFLVRAGKEERTVHIPRRLCKLVGDYVREVRPLLLPEGVNPADKGRALIFNERHQPYERTGLYRRVVRILTAAGLGRRASVQLLRHTYGYLAYLRTGGNLLFVQKQLGHSHPMVTVVYARFVKESYDELAGRVGNDDF